MPTSQSKFKAGDKVRVKKEAALKYPKQYSDMKVDWYRNRATISTDSTMFNVEGIAFVRCSWLDEDNELVEAFFSEDDLELKPLKKSKEALILKPLDPTSNKTSLP